MTQLDNFDSIKKLLERNKLLKANQEVIENHNRAMASEELEPVRKSKKAQAR